MAALYPDTVRQGINTPPAQNFDTPAMEGSMQQFLADNIGQYVVVEFLMGTNRLTTKSGVLYAVGTSVLTLYEELTQTFVTCDMFSIKFVTFYLPGRRPWQLSFPVQGQAPAPWGAPSMTGPMGMPAPGFAPSMDAAGQWPAGQDFAVQGGCAGGSCGAQSPSWG